MWVNKFDYYHPMFDKKAHRMRIYIHFDSIVTNIVFYDKHKLTAGWKTGVSILSKL